MKKEQILSQIINQFHFSLQIVRFPIEAKASQQITFLSELPEAVDVVSPTSASLPPGLPPFERAIQRVREACLLLQFGGLSVSQQSRAVLPTSKTTLAGKTIRGIRVPVTL